MARAKQAGRSWRLARIGWLAAVVAAAVAVPLAPAAPTAAASSGGSVYVWGLNFTGQLGNGTAFGSAVPVPLADVDGIVFTDIDIGSGFDLALAGDGTVFGWGQNSFGQLGRGTTSAVERTPRPVEMPGGMAFTAIAAGYQHGMGLAGDGTIYTWGRNDDGQLGDRTTDDRSSPAPVVMPEGVSFATLAGGQDASVALTHDGTVHTWGANDVGQLGNGTTDAGEHIPAPAVTPPGVRFTEVSAGARYAMALSQDGTVYTWGYNSFGQLGNGTTGGFDPTPAPVVMPDGVRFTDVSAGSRYAMALSEDGTVYTWGNNSFGQLGNGTSGSATSTDTPGPMAMPAGTSFAAIDGGAWMGAALTADGAMYVWGRNVNRRFGDGTSNSSDIPVQTEPPDGGTFGAIANSSGSQANGGLTGLPPHAVAKHHGDGQQVHVNRPFPDPLQAAVTTLTGGRVSGVPVTFTINSPATFDDGGASATALTGDDGVATSPPLTATAETGSVEVTATFPGASQPASFTLRVSEQPAPEPSQDPTAPPGPEPPRDPPGGTGADGAPNPPGTTGAVPPPATPDTGGRTGRLLGLGFALTAAGILLLAVTALAATRRPARRADRGATYRITSPSGG